MATRDAATPHPVELESRFVKTLGKAHKLSGISAPTPTLFSSPAARRCVYTSLVLRGNDTADVERGRIYSRADAYPHNEDGPGESSGGFGFLKHVESLLKGHYMGNAEKCSPRQRNFSAEC